MAKVKDELLDHDYDGIHEYDNPLPPWWVYLFIITIIWSVVYMFYYHFTDMGDSSKKEYVKEVQDWDNKIAALAASGNSELTYKAEDYVIKNDEATLNSGKAIFVKNCLSCHGQNLEGGVGPNLTDDYWIHGGKIENIVTTILNGVPEKGMITWKNTLLKKEVLAAANYIKSKKGTNPSNAKPPQGNLFKEEAQ
jgi:cytochrome c oxidase cbb3-type subunit 3